jgi:heme/copper-type cytochrome/quinol oxidase subunit 4
VEEMTEKSEPPTTGISSFSLVMIFITVILSTIALFLGLSTYESQDLSAVPYMLIGFIGLAISAYMLLQFRRKPSRAAFEMPKVITTILCQKCGFKNIRDFESGDYIFKETESCPKCSEKMMIAAIYREVKEKKK